MSLTVKPAFSAGELDPVIWERTTLDKYKAGCAVARNVIVTKVGGIASRQGRLNFKQCKLIGMPPLSYSPPGSGMVLEFGHQYVRIYSFAGILLFDVAHALTQSDLPSVQFETSGSYVYIFCSGKSTLKLLYTTGTFIDGASIFAIPIAPTGTKSVVGSGTPAGGAVEYAATYIQNGQESLPETVGTGLLPIANGQFNGVAVTLLVGGITLTNFQGVTQMNVYRRPTSNGVFGFIGSTNAFSVSSTNLVGNFYDLGQSADYTHSPPTEITSADPLALLSRTGVIYQQRLLISDAVTNLEAIYASRPGYQNNFWADSPLNAASALNFKAGSSGYAQVLRMLDSDGLVVFTAAGIFLNQGNLDVSNLSLIKKGRWIIDASLPALPVPGGVLFIDISTNSVRNLLWNLQIESFSAEEVSIYSQHLFKTKKIVSWNFQEGAFPLIHVVFNDGTMATFTFEFDQQMKAWTRHDSAAAITVENSCGTIVADTTFFVVSKADGTSYLEKTIPRYALPSELVSNPEARMGVSCAYMDSIVTTQDLYNDRLLGTDQFVFNPTTDDWSDPLQLTCGTSLLFGALNAALSQVGGSIVGEVFRYFDSDGSAYNFTVTELTDSNTVVVRPDQTIPSDLSNPRIYLTKTTYSGLSHLNGEDVSVIVDGAVVGSPNNDDQNYPTCTVANGLLTLPNSIRGAIVHIGRPITGDLETLDIDTVEQAPTLIESLNVNKLYIKTYNSSGLYVGNKFPNDGGLSGMLPLDCYDIDYSQENPIIGNRSAPPKTKRTELTLPGDWQSQGKICIRQVDPLHFEILSIIPDCEILTRSDR